MKELLIDIRSRVVRIEDAVFGYTDNKSGVMIRLDRLDQRALRTSRGLAWVWRTLAGAIVAIVGPKLWPKIVALFS